MAPREFEDVIIIGTGTEVSSVGVTVASRMSEIKVLIINSPGDFEDTSFKIRRFGKSLAMGAKICARAAKEKEFDEQHALTRESWLVPVNLFKSSAVHKRISNIIKSPSTHDRRVNKRKTFLRSLK